jgi:hypothetical protein
MPMSGSSKLETDQGRQGRTAGWSGRSRLAPVDRRPPGYRPGPAGQPVLGLNRPRLQKVARSPVRRRSRCDGPVQHRRSSSPAPGRRRLGGLPLGLRAHRGLCEVMRSPTAVQLTESLGRARSNRQKRWSEGSCKLAKGYWPADLIPIWDGSKPAGTEDERQRFRWSGVLWWACEDLNLGPLPYQQNAGNRCADRRLCWSRGTVGAEVKWSTGIQLSVLPIRLELKATSMPPHSSPA